MGRVEFGVFLAVASVPGMIFFFVGGVENASGWLAPVMGLMDAMHSAQSALGGGGGDLGALQQQLQQLQDGVGGGAAAPVVHHVDWGGLVNALLQLAMVPLCRMRLRDMGWTGWPEVVLTVLFNLTAVYGVVDALGAEGLPFDTLLSVVSFLGFIWLCMKGSAPRVAPHERIPG